MLRISGQVDQGRALSERDLADLPAEDQIDDVRQFGAKRAGKAVKLKAILELVGAKPEATHLGLHASRDDFHASVPLAPVRDQAFVIYQVDGQPLTTSAGGPFRFWIPDHGVCQSDEIDECANVKFVDEIELTVGRGHDNRPRDEQEHARLHESSHEE